MTVSELAYLLQTKSFYIYGNGYIAQRFFTCVENLGALRNLAGVIVTKADGRTIGINGKPVASIEEIRDTGALLLIAVHDAVVKEMEAVANRLGFQNVIWIYPYLWQLELGEPVKKNYSISVVQLAVAQKFYNVVIDYLAIQHILEGKSSNLYIKMQCAWSSSNVAEKRMVAFKEKILDVVKNGTHGSPPVKITERQELFDGMHRTAMALYFGMKTIEADVYSGAKNLYGENGIYRKGVLLEEDLPKHYTSEEIDEIKEANRKIRRL